MRNLTLFNPFESLLDEFFSDFGITNNKHIQKCKQSINFPRHNVKTNEQEVVIELAVPGYTEDILEVKVENDFLTIECLTDTNQSDYDILAHEIKSSYFKKSYEITDKNLSKDDIKCTLKDGILTITIPKIKPEELNKKQIKKIEIKK
jgi:HSP20 family molecular chaperone IbpA